jgi:hypothetical protein
MVDPGWHPGAVIELRGSEPLVITMQLCAVTVVGAIGLPSLAPLLYVGAAGVLVGLAVLAAFLGMIITATRAVTPLGETFWRRIVWVVVVLGAGLALGLLGWAASGEAGLNAGAVPLLGGVPFALVAGLLLRRWYLILSFGLVLAVIAAAGAVALRQSGPDEVSARLAHAGLDRSSAYVVEIPGYRPVDPGYGDGPGTGTFMPVEPAAIPAAKFVTVVAYRQPLVTEPGACGRTAMDSVLMSAECIREPGGRVYRKAVTHHGYQVRRGQLEVVVAGTFGVDRAVLRRAAATVRPATPAERLTDDQREIFAVTLPGYRGMEMGIPNGMEYQPAAGTSGGQSVQITVRADVTSVAALCAVAECSPAADELTYIRREHTHGFLMPRPDGVCLSVEGGALADTGRLRRAALDARLATDTELLRALPPAPVTGPLDRWRRWLREHP